MSARQPLYGVGLLDDIHTYFPDLLYDQSRFTDVQSILRYVREQTEEQFNLFTRGQREAQQRQPQPQQPAPTTTPVRPIQTHIPSAPVRPSRPVRNRSEGPFAPEGPFGANGYGIYNPPIVPITPIAEQMINTFDNVITETYDISNLFQIPAAQRQTRTDTNSLLSMLVNAVTAMPRADLEPVIVRPDTQTIERATSLRPARAADEEEVCSVCQENYTEGQAIRSITYCNHNFHKSCIDQWFERDVHCPVCRFDVRQTPAPE